MFVARGDRSIRTALEKYTTIGLAHIVHFVWLLINPGCSPTTRPQALTRPTKYSVFKLNARSTSARGVSFALGFSFFVNIQLIGGQTKALDQQNLYSDLYSMYS